MKTLKSLTAIILTLSVLSFLTSCEKIGENNKEERLHAEIKYVGYGYVILTVEVTGFDYIYNDATFYSSRFPDIDVNTATKSYHDVYQDRFYPEVLDMIPDTNYYCFAELNGVESNKIKLKSKKADFPCQVSNYKIMGDLTANQYGSFGSYNYLHNSDSYFGGQLGGDLKKINLRLPYGNWDPGVYTTYVEGEKFVHEPMRKNPEVTVEAFDGTIYTAKAGQVLWLKDGGGYDEQLVFCDMVFTGDDGTEITLSSNLAARIY